MNAPAPDWQNTTDPVVAVSALTQLPQTWEERVNEELDRIGFEERD